jgi:hypothetical protein
MGLLDEKSSDGDSQDEDYSEKRSVSAIAPSLVSSSMSGMKRLARKIYQNANSSMDSRDEKSSHEQQCTTDELDGLSEAMSSMGTSDSPRNSPMLQRRLKQSQNFATVDQSDRKSKLVESLVGEQLIPNTSNQTLLTIIPWRLCDSDG